MDRYPIMSGQVNLGVPVTMIMDGAVVEREWKPMPNESNDNFEYGVCGRIPPFAIQEFKNSLCDDELRSILSKHCGERGQVETYQECLRRIIDERDYAVCKMTAYVAHEPIKEQVEYASLSVVKTPSNPFYQKG